MRRDTSRNFGGVDRYTKLYMDGSSLVDNSLFGKTITNSGVSTSTNTPRFGGSSLSFPDPGGSLNQLRTTANDPDFIVGSRDFVIDFWMLPAITTISSQTLFSVWDGTNASTPTFAMTLGYDTSNYIGIWASSDHSNWNIIGVSPYQFSTATLAQWCHLAFVRSGSTCHLYVNGLRVYTAAFSGSIYQSATDAFVVGCWNSPMTGSFYGLMSQFRVSMDTDRGWTTPYIQVDSPNMANTTGKDIVEYTKLWIPGYGANNATDIADRSAYGRAITNTNVAVSTAQSKFNGSSLVFNGSAKQTCPNDAEFVLGTKDFVIQLWVNFNSSVSSQGGFLAQFQDSSNWRQFYHRNNLIYFIARNPSNDYAYLTWNFTPSIDTWYHLALVRNSANMLCYINGIRQTAVTISPDIGSNSLPYLNSTLSIGYDVNNGVYFNGYIQDFTHIVGTNLGYFGATIPVPSKPFTLDGVPQRPYTVQPYDGIANGIDKYTKLYLPLSEPSNTFTDKSFYGKTITNTSVTSSTTLTKFGGSSAYFNGSSYLVIPPSTELCSTSNNFVISFWFKVASASTSYMLVGHTGGGLNVREVFGLRVQGSGNNIQYTYTTNGSGSDERNLNFSWTQDTNLHYFTLVRSGTNAYCYIDGVRLSTSDSFGNDSIYFNITDPIWVGAYNYNGGLYQPYVGYMSEFKYIVGTDNGFTGPTIPVPTKPADIPFPLPRKQLLPATIANPVLYIKGYSTTDSNTVIYDSSPYARAITNTNVVTRTTNQKYGPSSMYFNGSSSYLSVAQSSSLNFTGDFVISFWFYPNALGYNAILFPQNDVSGAYLSIYFSDNSNNKRWYVTNGGYSPNLAIAYDDSTLNLTTWCHVAVVKSNNVVYLFRDGIQKTSASWTGTATNVNGWYVGRAWNPAGYLNGYLSELTIVNGSDLGYTGSTIPVPQGPLQLN